MNASSFVALLNPLSALLLFLMALVVLLKERKAVSDLFSHIVNVDGSS